MKKTEVIKKFLEINTYADLAILYNHDMEVQCNVAADGGTRVEADYKGRAWHGWTDGISTWKSFRIPRNASTNPEYEDTELNFDFDSHIEGIGMTGWDWKSKVSRWVAFDFDAMLGHKAEHRKKLTPAELDRAKEAAIAIPWTTIRKSTSGKGLHIYVPLDPVDTITHTEHAALARSIIGVMSAITGYDFSTRVDVCGGNMWVWHRKMRGTDGLTIIKNAEEEYVPNENWRDHIPVITGRRKRVLPSVIADTERQDTIVAFEDLVSQTTRVTLDEEHRKLIEWISNRGYYEQDNHMLVTHTAVLKQAHSELGLRGIFETLATGRDNPDINVFGFPLPNGAWALRRYTPGVAEAPTWEQDGSGWTKCYYNREPTLDVVAKSNDGVEHERGGYVFKEASLAQAAALALGVDLKLPPWIMNQRARIKPHRDGKRIIVEVDWREGDPNLEGWLLEKKMWRRIFITKTPPLIPPEVRNYDNMVRHLVMNGVDYGWVLRSSDAAWIKEPLAHISTALESLGIPSRDSKIVIGTGVLKHWTVVNEPFKEEYPGDRTWNLNAPQLSAVPSQNVDDLEYPTWLRILNHCGKGLDEVIKNNAWARVNGIHSGADYLKCWIASVIKEPFQPLPYLFFFGESNIGKSTFHDCLKLLLAGERGYMRADLAITNQSGFNAELINSVICVIEEMNLNKDRNAYNRIKDWVTSPNVLFHEKKKTPFLVRNSTHWIHTAQDSSHCPLFPGDTRITMIEVSALEPGEMIPRKELIPRLQKEVPDFLAALMNLEIPPSGDRLNIPVITTESKRQVEEANKTVLELFVDENCHYVPGASILFSEFFNRFQEWLEPRYIPEWGKRRVSAEIPSRFANGRRRSDNQRTIGNISWEKPTEDQKLNQKFVLREGVLFLEAV